jgi:alkylhydroperoxidase/carboxymuconolactone decarboxylase family protein YurZ
VNHGRTIALHTRVASERVTSLYSGFASLLAAVRNGLYRNTFDGRHSVFLKSTIKWAAGLMMAAALLTGQEPQWVDRAEYELVVEQIGKATDPKKRLELLNVWKQKYPKTAFESARREQFLLAYKDANNAKGMLGAAKDIAAAEPKRILGHYWIMLLGQSLAPTDPSVHADAEKASNLILANLDDFFAPANNAAKLPETAWNAQKIDSRDKSLQTLALLAQLKKDLPLSEKRLGDILRIINPKDAATTYRLGTIILQQRNVARQAEAIWHFSRACGIEGPGAVKAPEKAQICEYFRKVYPQYRGDTKGMEELKKSAADSAEPFPPKDFAIKTKQQEDIERLNDIIKTNPQLAIWIQTKQALTAADGDNYFNNSVKESKLPKLKGKIISHEPEVNPKKVVVGISDAAVAEVTLVMAEKTFLPGKMEAGGEIEFEGIGKEFTKEPFMLTLEIDKDTIYGWTGVATRPVPVKKAAPKGVVKKKTK